MPRCRFSPRFCRALLITAQRSRHYIDIVVRPWVVKVRWSSMPKWGGRRGFKAFGGLGSPSL